MKQKVDHSYCTMCPDIHEEVKVLRKALSCAVSALNSEKGRYDTIDTVIGQSYETVEEEEFINEAKEQLKEKKK